MGGGPMELLTEILTLALRIFAVACFVVVLLVAALYVFIAVALHRGRRAPSRRPRSNDQSVSIPLPAVRVGGDPGAGDAARTSGRGASRPDLDLSASAFAPISGAEAARLAKGLGGAIWTSPWFGRRDRIPPADDPRTAIIDRAMVGHGLITPDELAEIHRVGERMESVRSDLDQVYHVAERAVRQDREERKRLKEQKKREAAERKQRHAEQVAERRRTDVVFLGRGVSKGLADRVSDTAKLQSLGLPVLSTPADLASALGVTVPRLRWLAYHAEATEVTHYVRFTVPKRSGGTRELCAPHADLAAAQEWVRANVLAKVSIHDAAHGFVPGRSTVTNATPHVATAVVVNADLTDFFPTITFPRVLGIFRQLGYSPAVATVLALLCTESPRRRVTYAGRALWVAVGPRALPQGACTSPALSNLAARRLDSRLNGIAAKLGFRFTRYADDLTFSSPDADAKVGYLLARLRHITSDEGFAVNEFKTRVQRPGTRQTVTGIVVNARPGVPRQTVRRLRAILHRARTEGLGAQNREDHPHFEAWVRGMVAYVAMVNPGQAEPLREALAQLDGGGGATGGRAPT